DTWAAEYQRETQSEIEEKQQLQQEIKRLKSSAEQIEGWAKRAEAKTQKGRKSDLHARLDKGFLSHKAAKSMKRSQNTLKRTKSAIDEKQALMKNVDTVVPLTMKDEQPHQVHLMQVNQIQVGREGRILNQPLSFDLKRGQRLVLSGANGLGKTTIFKALMGQRDLIVNGTILKSPSIKISYLSQDFETLCGSIQAYADRFGIELNTFLNTLRKLGLERAAFDEDLGDLSMGQKRKISLARSLSEAANLYIWDEPLNYLDVITRQQIQDLILKHQPTMLIIDHDEAFIEAVKTGPLLKIQRFESN
ncbi:MAG: ATP-binding cassette domain-containing protein, partial [Lentilactobacillus parabuchneri]|nr:ATP-binding cassette domain-containing protein [Lentilactobacillus parabuchneri]